MGQLIPFIAKVSANGDWSAEERARLAELGDRFIASGLKVEVVYGATEEGDPWCVVKDEFEDVLIHVARIRGAFVIHYALDDALRQGDDLPAILGERLAEEERGDVVTPFSRQAQSLLALIVATAFFYETARHEEGAPAPMRLDHTGDPTGEDASHAAAQAAGAHQLDEAIAASHADPTIPAGPATLSPGDTESRPAEWRSFAASDDEAGRADHGGGELSAARMAPAGLPTLANLDVAAAPAPVAISPVVMAFDSRVAATDHLMPVSTFAPQTTGAPQGTGAPGSAFVSASFRPANPEHPTPATPQTTAPVVQVASHWVNVDLDGDGRPDIRVQVPDDPKAPSKAEPEPIHALDHEAITAVGHGFTHAEIV